MTRVFGQTYVCQHCGKASTTETALSRWIRNHPELESDKGFTTTDQDLFWHKYRTELGRTFQLMIDIEVKTRGGDLTESQRDTLYMRNQLLRNRRETPTRQLHYQSGNAPLQVYSTWLRRHVWLRHFGVHVLRFSGEGPGDSASIKWDKGQIDSETLLELLLFNLDPDSLRPMDWRSHHRRQSAEFVGTLWGEGEAAAAPMAPKGEH